MKSGQTSAAAIVYLGLVVLAGAARAEDEAGQARLLSARGLEAFKSAQYEEAIAAFEASYALVPVPALLFDSAQAHRLLGHCDEALARYRRYLIVAPAAKNHAAVAARIVEMQACAAAGAPGGPAPGPETSAPAHEAAAPVPSALSATAPAATAPVAALPVAAPVKPSERRAPIYKRWWLWSGVGALVAGGVVAGVLGATLRPTFHTTLPANGPGVSALSAAVTVRF